MALNLLSLQPSVYKSQSIKVSTCMYNVHKTCKTVSNLWTPNSLFTSLTVYIILVPFSHVCFHCNNMINMAPKDTFENCYDMTDRVHMLWLWINMPAKIFSGTFYLLIFSMAVKKKMMCGILTVSEGKWHWQSLMLFSRSRILFLYSSKGIMTNHNAHYSINFMSDNFFCLYL